MLEDSKLQSDLGYLRVFRALKEYDEPLYEVFKEKLNMPSYQTLIGRMKVDRNDDYLELVSCIESLEVGVVTPQIKKSLYSMAETLIKSYDCKSGFKDDGIEETVAVVVNLNMPDNVVGLPKNVITLSDNLARDYSKNGRVWTFGWDNRQFVAHVTWAALDAMLRDKNIADVVIDPVMHVQEIPEYNPSAENTDWGVSRVFPENAWAKGFNGQNVKLCICDTGLQSSHPEFIGLDYRGGYNFVANNEDPEDDHDHGTYCAGIVAGQHNVSPGQYRGIAPGVELYACKVLDAKGSGSFSLMAAAFDWCRTNGIHICSMSLGGQSGSATMKTAADQAWYAGLLLVAAAGNEGPGDNTVIYPAAYTSVMAVAAVDYNENVADFSSRGSQVEISAPGRAITSAWAGFTFKDYVVAGTNNKYICASGTSAACPHVSACAALMKNWYPTATNLELRQLLTQKARDL